MRVNDILNQDNHVIRMRIVKSEDADHVEFYQPEAKWMGNFTRGSPIYFKEPQEIWLGKPVNRYDLNELLGTNGYPTDNIFVQQQGLILDNGDVREWYLDADTMADVELVLYEEGLVDSLESGRHITGYMGFGPETRNAMPRIDMPEKPMQNASDWAGVYGMEKSREILLTKDENLANLEWPRGIHPVTITHDGELRVYSNIYGSREWLTRYSSEMILKANNPGNNSPIP